MDREVSVLLQAMREAGKAILRLQQTGFTVAFKAKDEIVTKADLVANDILKTTLNRAGPETGWLSEESVDDKHRLHCQRVWIVDPIDGTKEFAMLLPEYAISVALVENGMPILAAVFNPASDELFHAVKGRGAWLNDKLIHCQRRANVALTFLASRSEYQRGEWQRFEAQHHVKQVGSIAYKLGLIAAGCADATLSLGPKNEWDIAAGTLIASEAGCIVTDKHRQPLSFNRREVMVDGIVATVPEVNDEVFALIHAER